MTAGELGSPTDDGNGGEVDTDLVAAEHGSDNLLDRQGLVVTRRSDGLLEEGVQVDHGGGHVCLFLGS